MIRSSRDLLRTASRVAIAAGTAAFLTGCSGAGIFGSQRPADSSAIAAFEKNDPENQDFAAAAAYWGAKYEANRGDTDAAVNFARNLRSMGGARQAVAVLKDVVMKAPDDAKVLSEYGKALTAVGRAQDAIPFLARATQMDSSDWTTYSAYGVALDQNANHEAARRNYDIALKLSPDNPSVESNIAMSHILTGRVDQAEIILRRLVSRPDATPQMRQNLAMIASLKGNAAEAEQLAREDLAPEQATNNMVVLRQLDADNAAPLITPTPEAAAPATAPVAMAPVTEQAEQTEVAEQPAAPAIAEATIEETAPIVTASPAPAPAPAATRYQMAPVADDAEAPTAIIPKPAAAPKKDATKAATPAAASTQPAEKQSSLLRKSIDPQSISLANID
jgi:Flp pilus assembly protein TadD